MSTILQMSDDWKSASATEALAESFDRLATVDLRNSVWGRLLDYDQFCRRTDGCEWTTA
jgi:hypothetical protein